MIAGKFGTKNKPDQQQQLKLIADRLGYGANIIAVSDVNKNFRPQFNDISKEEKLERAVISLFGLFNHLSIPKLQSNTDQEGKLILKKEKTDQENKQAEQASERAETQAKFTMMFMKSLQQKDLPQYSQYNKEIFRKCLKKYNFEKFMSIDELDDCFDLLDKVLGCISQDRIQDLTKMTINKYTLTQQLLVHSLYLGSDFEIQSNYKITSNKERQIGDIKLKRCIRFKVTDFTGHRYANGRFIPPHTHLGVSLELRGDETTKEEVEGHFYLK